MDDLDALKQLTECEGWVIFLKYAHQQWSDSFVLNRIKSAASNIPSGDELSNHETARNLIAAQEAILSIIDWPAQQVVALSKNQTPKGADTPVGWFKRQVGR